jgi:hypothetical protein
MLTKIKTWFLRLKTWQRLVVGFMAFSVLVAPFSGGAETSAPAGDSGAAPQVTEMPEPTVTEMPTIAPTAAPSFAAGLTVGQENAMRKALSYIDFSGFSRKGLIEQLEFEGFTKDESQFAVDNIAINWDEQCIRKAQQYLNSMAFSRTGLIEQLVFEGFS